VAECFPDPAVQKSLAVDLALLGPYDHLLRTMELSSLNPAKHHQTHTLYWLRTVPGLGAILSLGRRYEIHDSARCPRVQDCVSYCRLGKVRQGIGRPALRHLRHEDRACAPQGGLLRCSTAQGAERGSLTPHWTIMG
jgi:hypothetical protein